MAGKERAGCFFPFVARGDSLYWQAYELRICTRFYRQANPQKPGVRNAEYTYAAPHTAEGHSDRCTALALALRAASGEGDAAHIGVIGDRRSLRRKVADNFRDAWTRLDHRRARTMKKIFG